MSKKRDQRSSKATPPASREPPTSADTKRPSNESPTGTTELEAVQIIHDDAPQPPPLPSDVLMPSTEDARQMRRSTARALRFLDQSGAAEFTRSSLPQPEVDSTGATARESQQDLVAAVLAVDRDEHTRDPARDLAEDPAKASPPAEGKTSPILSLPETPLPWHRIDYRGALLLARVDGKRSRDQVVAASGLAAAEASALLDELIAQGLLLTAPD